MIDRLRFALVAVVCLMGAACGGGGGGGGGFLTDETAAPLAITTNELPPLAQVPYAEVLEASGGREPYSWSMVNDDGTGLTVDDNGVLRADTGATPGRYAITIAVSDAAGARVERSLTIDVTLAQLAITTTALPAAPEGVAYSAILEADGGEAPFTWELLNDAGTGLTISSSDGLLSGAPATAPGTYGLTFRVTDSNGLSDQRALLLEVTGDTPGPLAITTASLPGATEGERYAAVLLAEGGSGNYTWRMINDGVSGLSLSASGVLGGFAPPGGSYGLTVEVSDGLNTEVAALVLTSAAVESNLVISTSSLPAAFPGTPYAAVVEANGGEGAYSWTLLSDGGTGLALSSSGVLSGIPGAAGTYGLTVRVTDSAGNTDTRALTIQVGDTGAVGDALLIATTELPRATAGEPYAVVLRAFGGSTPYAWSVRLDPDSSGLDFDPGPPDDSLTGLLSGTAPVAGSYEITIEVRDADSGVDLREYTLVVDP